MWPNKNPPQNLGQDFHAEFEQVLFFVHPWDLFVLRAWGMVPGIDDAFRFFLAGLCCYRP